MPSTTTDTDEFAESLTVPSDGDGPHIKAADVKIPIEGNANRTHYLRLRMQRLRALMWPSMASHDLKTGDATWSDKEQAWIVTSGVGSADDKWAASYDWGQGVIEWNQSSSMGFDLLAIAANTNGDVVGISTHRDTFKQIYAGYGSMQVPAFTPAVTANALSGAPTGGGLCWEDTAAKYIAVYRNGASGHKTENSTDGVTWTVHAPPSAWTGYTGSSNPVVAAIPGRAIAAFIGATTTVHIIRSTDGGGTWSTDVTFTAAFTPTIISKPVYDAFWNEWYMLLGAANHTQIIKSIDGGATWASTYTGIATGNDLACDDRLLVLITGDGRIAHSVDRGVSWQLGSGYAYATVASRFRIFAGGGGFLALNDMDGNSRTSLRFGAGVTL